MEIVLILALSISIAQSSKLSKFYSYSVRSIAQSSKTSKFYSYSLRCIVHDAFHVNTSRLRRIP